MGSEKHMATVSIEMDATLNAMPPYGGFKTAKAAQSSNKLSVFIPISIQR